METNTTTYTIDAAGKPLGRIATEAAMVLMGKNRTDYVPHKEANVAVVIENAAQLSLTGKKQEQKTYTSYSGYPGGLKKRNIQQVLTKHGYAEIVKRAVSGMLPKNKLRDRMMKNLVVKD